MTDNEALLTAILFIQLPVLMVWGYVLVDVVRRHDLPVPRKVLWVLACTLVWPILIVYMLVRPQRGRVERAAGRDDPHDQLVDAVMDHEAGRIDPAEFRRRVAVLRAGSVHQHRSEGAQEGT